MIRVVDEGAEQDDLRGANEGTEDPTTKWHLPQISTVHSKSVTLAPYSKWHKCDRLCSLCREEYAGQEAEASLLGHSLFIDHVKLTQDLIDRFRITMTTYLVCVECKSYCRVGLGEVKERVAEVIGIQDADIVLNDVRNIQEDLDYVLVISSCIQQF